MSKVQINKRLLYVLAFLFVAIPILVGVLVWHFTDKASKSSGDGSSQKGHTNLPHEGESTTSSGLTPATTLTPSPEEIAVKPWLSLRLPSYQVPLHYDITLYPDFYDGHGTFYGNETVEVAVNQTTKYLLIHVYKLDIQAVSVVQKDSGKDLEVARSFEEVKNQFLVVETKEDIVEGSVVDLKLQFSGSLTDSIVGFYKSRYVNSKTGKTRYLATSKFEPVSARRAFPCMDEPSLKSEFTITLIHRPEYTPLSNMPPDGEPFPVADREGLLWTRFQRSVKMSTYLVCFIVCDFEYKEDYTRSGTRVRVYATPDKVDQTLYALQVGVHTMQEYEVLFNISYPLPKQDMIAIPDFVSGAMEHWGLITYREVNLLYDPKKASAANKQRVAVVVAHEISHQWFGNLVTMAWWNDLWLNEGFASFMEYIGTDTMQPDWDMMSQFLISDAQPVMGIDAGVSSHPIVVPVNSPSEINEVFDAISYSKGASVIRMMKSIMGKEKFFKGVSIYLKRYMWGNAETDQLWEALSQVEGAPNVKYIMDTWTRQMGFPYINLTFTPHPQVRGSPTRSTTTTTTTVTATQARFLADPGAVFDEDQSPFRYKWYVSLDCLTSADQKTVNILNLTDVTFQLSTNTDDPHSWVKCNLEQSGFYRVNYPPSNWKQLARMLRSTPVQSWKLSAADRSGLLDDAMNLARAGLLGYDVALEMTSYLNLEDSFIPWQSTYDSLTYISSMLMFDTDYGLWRGFVLSIVSPALDRLGWEDVGTDLHKRLRGLLIDLACKHGDPACLANATAKFRNWLDRNVTPPVNTKSLVYKWGMWAGGSAEDWNTVWHKYQTEVVPQEKINLLRALSMTKSPWLLARLLGFTKEGRKIRRQDFIIVVRLVALNPAARSHLWSWVQRNWQQFVERFTLFDRYFGQVVPTVTTTFNTEFDKQQVLDFFKKYPEAGAGARGRQRAVEKMTQNIYWMTHFKPTVVQWLHYQKELQMAQG
ncbi:glutamyl aminopeptidase-like [Babylonia areolata]|uniref:glutamyl aminopeptidase-like n=1 Tax=Babylonia areolata TaxID=304850 RepID=UPI003FD07EAD